MIDGGDQGGPAPPEPGSPTICADCTHCSQYRGSGATWYNWFCLHPDLERPLVLDPVTGEQVYSATNDLGRVYPTNEKHPHCRDVNTGSCVHFRPRSVVSKILPRRNREP